MKPPAKKLLLIFVITLICLFISLPQELAVGERIIKRPNLNISIGKIQIHKNFDLVLGLDLAGGSHLVFEADTSKIESDKKKQAIESLKRVIEKRVNYFGISEPNIQTSKFEGKDRMVVELPGIHNTQEAINLIGRTAQLVFAEVNIPEAVENEEPPPITGDSFSPTDLTGADLKEAQVVFDQTSGSPAVSLEFTVEGGEKFGQITEENIGKPLAILLDGSPVSAPIVQQKITGGTAQISGEFDLDQAKNLVIQLNAGALPVSIELVEQRTVGATLGGESVAKSIMAGMVGLLMVLLFMILVYGKMGVFADIGLIIFGIITLAIYKIIPVVLTLPGIAGFLLSVGMAVDSNILIFERFKEERVKRDFVNALEVSFGRAWDSIRDANVATLVAAFVLANPLDFSFLHTSGPVRGFAVTLGIGIGVSLFTGIVVTRNLLRVFLRPPKSIK